MPVYALVNKLDHESPQALGNKVFVETRLQELIDSAKSDIEKQQIINNYEIRQINFYAN